MVDSIKIETTSVTTVLHKEGNPRVNIDMRTPTKLAPLVIDTDYTLKSSDLGRWIISDASAPINLFYPPDVLAGRIDIFQRGGGQIALVPINGAEFANAELRSAGRLSEKKKMTLYSYGNGTAMLYGDTAESLLEWSIVGNTTVREGDSAVYVIWRPDSTNGFPGGVTITVSSADLDAAGFDHTLVSALTALTQLDPKVTFDGVDTLTILPGARNPLPLHFFAKPLYTATGDRTCTVTIGSPSEGDLSPLASSAMTTVLNTSRPWEPSEILATRTITTASPVAVSATSILLTSVTGLVKFGVLTHASLPARTYITAINGNTITLSAAATGAIGAAASITYRKPGVHFDFSSTTNLTVDGSNKCSVATSTVNGATIGNTGTGRPTYVPAVLNGQGAMRFAASPEVLTTNDPWLATMLNDARSACTFVVVGTVTSAATNGTWIEGRYTLTDQASGSPFVRSSSATVEVKTADTLGIPHIWSWKNDGSNNGGQVHCNGQRLHIPATITADAAAGQRVVLLDDTTSLVAGMYIACSPYGGLKQPGSDTTIGIPGANFFNITSVDSPTQITVNQNIFTGGLKAGQTLQFFSLQQSYGASAAVAGTATTFSVGATSTGTNRIVGDIHEIFFAPYVLTPQEWRGLILRLSNKYSTSTSATTTASSAAGTKSVTLDSTTNVRLYQTVSGTNIKPGSTVIRVNHTTKVVTLDEEILTGGVASSATLNFHNCSFKKPDLIDVVAMRAAYRDDYANGPTFGNSGDTMQPYYGDINSPGTYPSAYGSLGHGSSNGGANEKQWYLDVYNWARWLRNNPFQRYKDTDVPKGGLKITASPAPADILPDIGYVLPNTTAYTYVSGYMKDAGGFPQTYGYWESRIKFNRVPNSWGAFWLTAANGVWPGEVDIIEHYGANPASIPYTMHCNRSFTQTDSGRSVANYGEVLVDASEEYVLFGVEMTPTKVTFYTNREKMVSFTPQWDFHAPWLMQLNMAVEAIHTGATPDNVTPMPMYIDYAAAWARPLQVLSPTGATQAETTALLAAMSGAPSGARQIIINRMIEKLKLYQTDHCGSAWTAIDTLFVMAAHDEQAARIDWKNPARIATKVGTPTFVVDRGYSGVTNTSYLEYPNVLSTESFNLNSTLNQSHIGCIVRDVVNTTSLVFGTTNFSINPRSSGTVQIKLWGASKTPTKSGNGHYVGTRNHFRYGHHKDGELYTTRDASGIGSDTRVTDVEKPKMANGTTRVCLVHAGDFLTQNDVEGINAIFAEYTTAVGAL